MKIASIVFGVLAFVLYVLLFFSWRTVLYDYGGLIFFSALGLGFLCFLTGLASWWKSQGSLPLVLGIILTLLGIFLLLYLTPSKSNVEPIEVTQLIQF